jgi:hypothetical protein
MAPAVWYLKVVPVYVNNESVRSNRCHWTGHDAFFDVDAVILDRLREIRSPCMLIALILVSDLLGDEFFSGSGEN